MLHRYLYDHQEPRSLAAMVRRQRFEIFRRMLARETKPASVLDVGGRQEFWEAMGYPRPGDHGFEVVLLNSETVTVNGEGFRVVLGDGRSMGQFHDGQFEIVVSNSTIEHAGSWEDQKRMAEEIQRVGKRYFVQTPNKFFPVEPHFLVPCFQFMPLGLRAWLIRHFELGWYEKAMDRTTATEIAASIRLLNLREVQTLFPEAVVFKERIAGLVKSFVAYR